VRGRRVRGELPIWDGLILQGVDTFYPPVIILLALIPILWLSKTCLALRSNYRRARQTGLPIVISPVDPLSPIWMLAHRQLIPLFERLPSSWSRWTRYSYVGWAFDDR
jgi:hypothetical protein